MEERLGRSVAAEYHRNNTGALEAERVERRELEQRMETKYDTGWQTMAERLEEKYAAGLQALEERLKKLHVTGDALEAEEQRALEQRMKAQYDTGCQKMEERLEAKYAA